MEDAGRAMAAARPKVVAALAARLRDLDMAEEAFAEACVAAIAAWRREPPRDPAAWLWRAALHKAFDAKRRLAVRAQAVHDERPAAPTPEDDLLAADEPIPDERLRLIFVCCHPAVGAEARAALTLKVVCGLSTERLARAFLVAEPAMLQRITRAKRKTRDAAVSFEVPARESWSERLEAVLATLEIAYAQAYQDAALADDGALFAQEVLRLSGVLVELMPREPEVLGLAALVRFAEARRPARLDADGAMIAPSLQDDRLWRADLIAEGTHLLDSAAGFGVLGPRQLMAAIHGAHLSRRETGMTPWADIVGLYDALMNFRPDPVTAVNRAVAVGEARGMSAGLAALQEIPGGGRLASWLPYQAARAGLCEGAGLLADAAGAYRAALALKPAPAERRYLEHRLAGLALAR
ncbi:MAG: RNA polymerase sigma factor [Phenylobacterium sp.]|uniref:RNA polymerase sigma factor n=1 Tax=Phenylobacterium sp. TaxID=1871053 RepID=UPI0027262A01|nr:DUF6596 domain-containing protein [Phenylobacterium sp.]MDO9432546.1 RNA polymerase sigma factor [Phenylobacterium sp.]